MLNLDILPYPTLHDFINKTENQDNTFSCDLTENIHKLFIIFLEEYISSERFKAINTIKNSKVNVDVVHNHSSMLISNCTTGICEVKVSHFVHVLDSLMHEL